MLIISKNKSFYNRLCQVGLLTAMIFSSQKEAAFAQVNADDSLPSNSQIQQQGNIYNITGGTEAGNNLFHSFEKFSVPNDGEAYFNNAVNVQNIINRVTGKSISEINGLIRANGTANLFLINPNGIVFGENAKFDIGGSFIGSTADSFKFNDGKEFSAINPEDKPLLSINVPLGLQYGKNPGNIQVKGQGDTQRSTPEIFEPKSGLQLPVDKTLALLGGDILLEGATLKAGGGRIELASVKEGLVSILPVEKGFNFDFDKLDNFGEVKLSQNTAVDASGNGAGNIRVAGKNIAIADSSVISSTQTGVEKAANIIINATVEVDINGINDTFIRSGLYANNISDNPAIETSNIAVDAQNLKVRDGATIVTNGNDALGGDINIKASNFKVENGGIFSAIVSSSGNGGNIDIDAAEVQVIGVGNNNNFSELSVSAKDNSTGNTGNLNITTNNLLVEDGGLIYAGTSGKGHGGNMTINATYKIKAAGQGGVDNQFSSGLFVVAEDNSSGNSGSLIINTEQMLVQSGAFVSASNNGSGSAGDLQITSDDLLIQDNARFFAGSISEGKRVRDLSIKTSNLLISGGSEVNAGISNLDGNLDIDAEDIQVIGTGNNGNTPTSLTVSASGQNVGNMNIKTKRIIIKDGAFLSTNALGEGNGGNLNINAEDIQVIGKGGNNPGNSNLPYLSGLFVTAESSSSGNAGELTINTKRMLVQDDAFVSSSTNSIGDGGHLTIDANRLRVQKGASIISGTSSEGVGGNLKITANSLLLEDRAKIGSDTSGMGNAGNLNIDADILQVKDKSQVTVEGETFGRGNAGILELNARSIRLDNEASLNASTQSTDSNREQATININSQDLILRRGSNIKTNARGENVQGGNININSEIIAAIENSNISADSENFRGGNVKIEAMAIFNTGFSDITATGANPDLSGTVEINTPYINSTNELSDLPSIPINTKLTQGCYSPGYAQNQFFIVGRGGLPPNPEDSLTPSAVRVDWVSPQRNSENISTRNRDIEIKSSTEKPERIVEATGWVSNGKGEIIFTADPPVAIADTSIKQAQNCEF
ncbi:filamentous hemagglutinin family outer membrane protein [Calothrix parasitica NIES-267]|uniref:Filamentous hemagglutinin family outer membrane protein n=1 Tax=Calothrix parasitica NIES-267 TaxID=1973488 RepID=A0A1Z4M244_9CYAN|nr:filamentous hemagglutinin family outer membrane protein [Calothrix parasitica NIES-267]